MTSVLAKRIFSAMNKGEHLKLPEISRALRLKNRLSKSAINQCNGQIEENFYHFTNKENYAKMLQTRYIQPSKDGVSCSSR